MDVSSNIIENAKILLKHYITLKHEFKNVEFWGEEVYHQFDNKIKELREIILKYKGEQNEKER